MKNMISQLESFSTVRANAVVSFYRVFAVWAGSCGAKWTMTGCLTWSIGQICTSTRQRRTCASWSIIPMINHWTLWNYLIAKARRWSVRWARRCFSLRISWTWSVKTTGIARRRSRMETRLCIRWFTLCYWRGQWFSKSGKVWASSSSDYENSWKEGTYDYDCRNCTDGGRGPKSCFGLNRSLCGNGSKAERGTRKVWTLIRSYIRRGRIVARRWGRNRGYHERRTRADTVWTCRGYSITSVRNSRNCEGSINSTKHARVWICHMSLSKVNWNWSAWRKTQTIYWDYSSWNSLRGRKLKNRTALSFWTVDRE